jgi:hypothetical protein
MARFPQALGELRRARELEELACVSNRCRVEDAGIDVWQLERGDRDEHHDAVPPAGRLLADVTGVRRVER